MNIHNQSTVLILSRNSDIIIPFLDSVAYDAMIHNYFHVEHDRMISMIPHQTLSLLSRGLPSSVDVNESSSLWKSIQDLSIEYFLFVWIMDDGCRRKGILSFQVAKNHFRSTIKSVHRFVLSVSLNILSTFNLFRV